MVGGRLARPCQLPVHQRRDAAIAIGRPLVDEAADQRQQGLVVRLAIRAARLRCSTDFLMKMRTRDAECLGDRLHRESSFGSDKSRKLGFFDFDLARASRRISTLHGLAAEQPLQLADALFEPAHLRAADNGSSDPTAALLPRSSTAANDTAGWAPPRAARNRRHRLPGLEALLDDPQLLLRRPVPPASRAGDQFDPSIVVRHKPMLEDILKPSRLCRLSGRNGGQFTSSNSGRKISKPSIFTTRAIYSSSTSLAIS